MSLIYSAPAMLLIACPLCGKDDPSDRFFCPSRDTEGSDRCDGCEECPHPFHEFLPELTPITGDSAHAPKA